MKKYYFHIKPDHPAAKTHSVVRKHHLPHTHWTPWTTFALAILLSYLLYALCSRIPVMSLQLTGAWQLFG